MFEQFYVNLKEQAKQMLLTINPESKEEYIKHFNDTNYYIDSECFKTMIRDRLADYEIENDLVKKDIVEKVVAVIGFCMHMLIEIELAKDEIKKIELNNFMMICGSPRSGTTFLFDCIMSNNKLKANKHYQIYFPGTKLMKKELKIKLVEEFLKDVIKGDISQQHRIDILNKPEESIATQNWLGMIFTIAIKDIRYFTTT